MNLQASDLLPHPEGGRFREVHRSRIRVNDEQGTSKSALTHIYFNLSAKEVSRFHRVVQEEVWNLYRGRLRLWILNPETLEMTRIDLSEAENTFCAVIPPGHWQAAECRSDEVLVGCTVAPGFEFQDFELITPDHVLCSPIRESGLDHLL